MALTMQQAVVPSSLKLSRPVATAAAAQQTTCSSSSSAAGLKSRGLALTAAAPAPLATSWWRDLASALPSASSSCSASRRSFAVRADASEGASSATAVVEEEAEVAEVEDSAAADAPTKTVTQVKDIMNILTQQSAQTLRAERGLPNLRPGDVIAMKVEVPENKRRVSLVRGIVIARHNAGINSTFRIRRIMAGVGVEMVFPLFSPNIKEIKVVDKRRARRAKLYYLRDKIARLSTVN